jgi:septal ring factor EnvC (AmiA/AmiB activator)
MKQQLEQRLKELRVEYAAGQKVHGELKNKQAELRKTLFRINSSIQVLEAELSKETIMEEDRLKKTIG